MSSDNEETVEEVEVPKVDSKRRKRVIKPSGKIGKKFISENRMLELINNISTTEEGRIETKNLRHSKQIELDKASRKKILDKRREKKFELKKAKILVSGEKAKRKLERKDADIELALESSSSTKKVVSFQID